MIFFIKQLTAHRRALIIGVLLTFILAFTSIALLSLSGWFVTAAAFAGLSVATASAFNYFIPASLVRLLALIRILSRYADRVVNHDYTFKILTQLRVWFYQKLIPLSPARLLSQRSGDLLNRMVNDIDTLDHLYLNIASPFFITILMILSSCVFISFFSKKIAIINLCIILISLFLICFMTIKSVIQTGKNIQHAQSALRIKLIEICQGFVDLLLFEKKETRNNALNAHQQALNQYQKKLSRLKGFISAGMVLASGVSVFFTVWIGILYVHAHQLNGAILAMIVFLIIALYEQLITLPMACLALGKTKEAANRVLAVAHQTPAVVFSPDTGALACARASIALNKRNHTVTLQHISFSYPDQSKLILNNFSCAVSTGEHIGLNAPSGAGKTTLFNLIARIFDPDLGNIFIGDKNLKHFSENGLRKLISTVTQQVHIFNASVRDNITLFEKNVDDDLIWYWLEKMDLAQTIAHLPEKLNTVMGEFGKNFSGGQIRRIALARGLFSNTPILLLDEPSTGLNDALIHRIWKNCENDFKNKTIIVATHEKQLLEKLRVICL